MLANAVKYTDQGHIEVNTRCSGGIVEISFADTGIGIPMGEANRLFQEFKRLSNTFNYNGTGLGLALCKILANLNEAEVFYRPNIHGGSTFGLRCRYAVNTQVDTNAKAFNQILIIDDDDAVRRTNARYMRNHAIELLEAATYREAEEILSQHSPDLIISDLNLHSSKITTLLKNLPKIPTIIITGSAQDQDLLPISANKNIIVLEKPVSRSELLAAVNGLYNNNGENH